MSRFKRGRFRSEAAIFSDSATETGAESQVDGATRLSFGFVNSGEIGIVSEEDGTFEKTFQEGDEIKVLPAREIRCNKRAIIFDDTREGNGHDFDIVIFGQEELEAVGKVGSEFIRVGISEKAEFLFEAAKIGEEHDFCFGASNIDSEIHKLIISYRIV